MRSGGKYERVGNKVRRTAGTTDHPDGNGPRNADGTSVHHAPASQPAKSESKSSDKAAGKSTESKE